MLATKAVASHTWHHAVDLSQAVTQASKQAMLIHSPFHQSTYFVDVKQSVTYLLLTVVLLLLSSDTHHTNNTLTTHTIPIHL